MQRKKIEKFIFHFIDSSDKWPLLFIATLIAISYSNSIYSPFVLDDLHSFINEPKVYLKDFSLESMKELATTKFGKARFLPLLTFVMNHIIGGGKSIVPYHLTNIAIHILTAVAFFFFLKGLLKTNIGRRSLQFLTPQQFCFFTIAFWALNPVQTNAVTYIVQRMTSMAALFYISAMAFYIYGRLSPELIKKVFFFSCSLLACICAFHSKQNSATLPVAILLIEFMFVSPGLAKTIIQKSKWYHWTALILLMIVLLPLGEQFWNNNLKGYANRHFTMYERVLTQPRVIAFYLSLLLLPLPSRMNLEHDFAISHSLLVPPTTIISIVFIILLIGSAIAFKKRFPLLSFGLFFFFLNLIIESTFINLELVFEHRLYLPSMGFFIVLFWLFDQILKQLYKKWGSQELMKVFFLAGLIFLSASSVLTTFRNNDWKDTVNLYRDCVEKSPNKPRGYLNLGVALGRQGDYEGSMNVLKKAIELGQPQYEEYINSANNIIVALIEQGRYEEAIEQGENYIKEEPSQTNLSGYTKFMYNLGYAYLSVGEYTKALKSYISGFVLEQKNANGHFVDKMLETLMMGYDNPEIRVKLSMTEEEGDKLKSVLLRMAKLLLDLRDYERANDFLNNLLASYPEDEQALVLKKRYEQEREKNKLQIKVATLQEHHIYKLDKTYQLCFDLAEFILNSYSPLTPIVDQLLNIAENKILSTDPFIDLYRVKSYMKRGMAEEAVVTLERAVQRYPDFIPLLEIYGSYYRKNGNNIVAAETFEHILKIYPGHPRWYFFLKVVSQNEDQLKLLREEMAGA